MLNKLLLPFIVVISTAAGFFLSKYYSNSSHQCPYSNIAVINTARVREQAIVFKQLSGLIEQEHNKAQKKIMEMENKLRDQYEELKKIERNKKKLPEILKKKQDFEKQVAELEQKVQQEREKLGQKFASLQSRIEGALKDVLDKIVSEKNLQLVLSTSILDNEVVITADQTFNITDLVIESLNKKMPNIQEESAQR